MSYQEAKKIDIKDELKLHIGQFKLFLSLLLFLTKKAKSGNKLLYVGAAEGYNIAKVADLFPEIEFELWDPRKFDILPRKNIKLFNKLFTHEDAEKYKKENKNLLFFSDIRNLDIGIAKKLDDQPGMDKIVDDDLTMQVEWIQMIRPLYACIKFRLPYHIKTTKSLTGKIYLQHFSPLSTETRLMTNDYDTMITYDNIEFDEKMAYFNYVTRLAEPKKDKKWYDLMKEHKLAYHWDNLISLYIIDFYLKKIKKIDSAEKTVKFYLEILDFFIKKYGERKFSVVFSK